MRLAGLLPTLLLSALIALAAAPAPASSIHDEPPVQMEVSPIRTGP